MTNRAHIFASIFLAIVALNCQAANESFAVPIKLRGHFPLVNVKIEGRNVPLILDSGNSGTLALTQEVIDEVKAVPTGQTSKSKDAKGNVIEYPKFKISRVEIGKALFTDVVVDLDVHDATYQPTKVGQQGFLGTTLLKAYQVVLDYPHRQVIFIQPDNANIQPNNCRGTRVPFSPMWGGEPVTDVGIDVGQLTMWWDTGSPTSVLSNRFAQQARLPKSQDTLTTKRLTLEGAEFGPLRFEIWDVSLPPGFDGFIGSNFFMRHVVCVDFPGKQLVIAR